MIPSPTQERVAAWLLGSLRMFSAMQLHVAKHPNKDEAAESFAKCCHENGLRMSPAGDQITKTAIRYAMRQIR